MRLRARVPRLFSSNLETGPEASRPVLDGSPVVVPNTWNLPPHAVAVVGRPAVWVVLDIKTPRIELGIVSLPPRRIRAEQDFGGHLYLLVTGEDAAHAELIEGGPLRRRGADGLVPFAYPEADFAKRGVIDFDPILIPPPLGITAEFFAELLRSAQREYDGDQRYLAIEIPFLRVGRDSNSYAVGVLLASGVDTRKLPKPGKALRYELTGYPGAEDPVHRGNFGAYPGAPGKLEDGVFDMGYHNADGSVRLVVVGGKPNGRARLPDGSEVELDDLGRRAFAPDEASRHGLPTSYTEPPEQIRRRRHYPADAAPSGAQITLIVDGRSAPLVPGDAYTGTIVDRHDALGIAWLRTEKGDVVLPLIELGVELRDPERVDRLLRVGSKLTVGLHRDRRPKLVAHGDGATDDAFLSRRFHAPPWRKAIPLTAFGVAACAGGLYWFLRTNASR
jgi:hypothetical protein